VRRFVADVMNLESGILDERWKYFLTDTVYTVNTLDDSRLLSVQYINNSTMCHSYHRQSTHKQVSVFNRKKRYAVTILGLCL